MSNKDIFCNFVYFIYCPSLIFFIISLIHVPFFILDNSVEITVK